MNEFEIIQKYFRPLTQGHDNLSDDAAVLRIPGGQELVVTSDTLNEGVHFLPQTWPSDIAHKALRVNLSDLAAMGATPLSYQLNIAFSDRMDEDWLSAFTQALLADQKEFGIFCSGGDTTRTKGPLSISITAMGLVPEGQAIRREGAQDGDTLFLTGPVGDAYIGLHLLSFPPPYANAPDAGTQKFTDTAQRHFINRYYKPQPRLDLIAPLRAYTNAATDISDGLLADLGHICTASDLGAEVSLRKSFFSPHARKMIAQKLVTPEELLSGGDDYEILVAVPQDNVAAFKRDVHRAIQIGAFKAGVPEVTLTDETDERLEMKHTGWSHF